jgi:hypothetical protein
MPNLKRTQVGYQPFRGQAVLADGLLAVRRPGGELMQSVSQAMFGLADAAGQVAEQSRQRAAVATGLKTVADAKVGVTVKGGDRAQVAGGAVPGNVSAPAPVRDAIAAAAARHGQSPDVMLRIAGIESSMNPAAKNASGAAGLFQFMPTTAARYGLSNPYDAAASADAAARLLRDNGNYLRQKLGRDPTAGELYLAHQQGAGGAVSLLKNPAASAVSVVGRKAVLQNGGAENMTAGQFASLWTRRLGDAPIKEGIGPAPAIDLPPALSGDAPLTGERSALSLTVSGAMPALSGRDTIYGRAYDKVVTQAFTQKLNDAMLTAGDEIASKYADDPEGMAQAFSQLRDVQMQGDVPPEIQLDYDHAFNSMQRTYLRQAQDGHERKLKQEDAAKWEAGSATYGDAMGRAQAGLDPANPDSLTVLQGQAARMKAHWRDGVARGLITPAKAEELSRGLDGNVQATWYVGQAKGKTGDEIDALRDTLKADYAAGKLDGVTADAWDKIDTGLQNEARATRQKTAADEAQLAKAADSLLARAALGFDVPQSEIDQLGLAAARVTDGDKVTAGIPAVLDVAKALRAGPLATADQKLKDLHTSIGNTPTPEQVVLLGKAEDMVAKAHVALAEDPLAFAQRAGVVADVGSLSDVKTADDMQVLIEKRGAAAEATARHFGIAEHYLRPGEAKAIEAMVTADPDAGAAMAGRMIVAAGPKANSLLREFGDTAPVLAGAGAIIAGGGDMVAARDAIAGSGKDATGKAYSSEGSAQRRSTAIEVAGNALEFQPEDMARVQTTAELIARKRIAEKGLKPGDPEADAVMERATNEAAGAVYDKGVQWGGFGEYDPGLWASPQKVVVPTNMRADRLGDVIDALRPDDFKVQPQGGMARLQELYPVLTKDGYMFVDFAEDGSALPLAGEDGRPFVADLQGLAMRLGPRVPGAFRGW